MLGNAFLEKSEKSALSWYSEVLSALGMWQIWFLVVLVTEDVEIAQPGNARWAPPFPQSENGGTDYGFNSVPLPQPPKEEPCGVTSVWRGRYRPQPQQKTENENTWVGNPRKDRETITGESMDKQGTKACKIQPKLKAGTGFGLFLFSLFSPFNSQ